MPPLNTLNKTALALAIAQTVTISSAQASTIIVDDFTDAGGSGCTLRQAIVSANNDATPAGSNCIAGANNDIIRFNNTQAQNIGLTQGALSITSNIDILAPFHASIVIDGSNNTANTPNVSIGSNSSTPTVTLDHLTIKDAKAEGIITLSTTQTTVSNSSIIDNSGTGISSRNFSTLIIDRSTIAGNSYGGVSASTATTISRSTISNNYANTIIGAGGVISDSGTGTVLNISNSTITGNTSTRVGGIVFNDGALNLTENIISGNIISAAGFEPVREIRAGGGVSPVSINSTRNLIGSDATTDSEAFNGFSTSSSDINGNSNQQNIPLSNILETVLSDNGGPTLTHSLVTGSPAIGVIVNNFLLCNQADQRNIMRGNSQISNNDCDLGSVEYLPTGRTVTVTTNIGNNNSNYSCSLLNAIEVINTNRVVYGCASGGINDTIIFAPAIDTVTLSSALPAIIANVTIQGNGVTIDAANTARVLSVANGAKIEISDITLNNGNTTEFGAGLSADNNSYVAISNSEISSNTTTTRGGGVAATNSSTMIIDDSTISNNSAGVRGGGVISFVYSHIELNRSTISTNNSLDGAGLLANGSASIDINDSLIHMNSATRLGGGIESIYDGTINVSNSTISGNSAGSQFGGAFVNFDSKVSINNSSLMENFSPSSGGVGLLRNSTFSFQNSILSNTGVEINATGGFAASLGNNIIGNNIKTNSQSFIGFIPLASDITATSDGTQPTAAAAIFGPLSDNGGLTQTHALVANSPALDAANNDICPSEDQRGESRSDGLCDIGAFEAQDGEVQFDDEETCFVVKAANGNAVIFCL